MTPVERYLQISRMIDHSLLSPALTHSDMEAGIELALKYEVASVCILPYYVKRCAERLQGSEVQPSTTIGFPHGAVTAILKQKEAEAAVENGCQELDMVVNISQVLSGEWEAVRQDIKGVIDVAHAAERKVKVIFENCFLQQEQKIRLCKICSELNADWVKTSTGYGSGGATLEDVQLMRQHSAPQVAVKAAGGIRDLSTLQAMRERGAARIGASQTAAILEELRSQLGLPQLAGGAAPPPTGY